MIQPPDLLHQEARSSIRRESVFATLELAFLGKEVDRDVDRVIGEAATVRDGFDAELFARDLFVRDLIRDHFTLRFAGENYPVNEDFLYLVLTHPPRDVGTVLFRQEILRELSENASLRHAAEELYQELAALLAMFKVPDYVARLDINQHRLDTFQNVLTIVDRMAADFGTARSGLRRISESGRAIQESEEYATLKNLLDYERRFMGVNVDLVLGPEGRVRRLDIRKVEENRKNPFFRPPGKRLLDRMRLFFWHGTMLSNRQIVNRLLHRVFVELSPSIILLFELLGQLEFYLTGLELRRVAKEHGLEMSFPRFDSGAPLRLVRAFNPHLLGQRRPPVPADVERRSALGVTLLTGPNSGGKTRLLQTVGLSQLLGQAGLFVPAAKAELPLLRGLFVSLIESEEADQAEGRLGREMLRIRKLFEGLDSPAMVILDELCSGTNPSEGTELFSLVLRLLERLGSVAFISTHFLDYGRELAADPPVDGLEFLQVDIDEEQRSTYQFLPGVAETSLAAVTAERLGVTFEQLAAVIEERH